MFYSIKTFANHYVEIVVRTEVVETNNWSVEYSMDYFTDDSMESIKREIINKEHADRIGLDLSRLNEKNMIGLNACPINSGLIVMDSWS